MILKNSNVSEIEQIIALEAEICKRSFYYFIKQAWPIVEPGTRFQDNWHIEMLANLLTDFYEGKARNVLINIAPRSGKSTILNQLWVAWVLAKDPSKQILCIANNEELASKDSVRCRNLIKSRWYQQRFPNVQIKRDQNQKLAYETTMNGARRAFGLKSGFLGFGGNYVLVDDPNSIDDIHSETITKNIEETYDYGVSSRLNDPKSGGICVIQQRLSMSDLTSHIMDSQEYKNGRWQHIILPMEYEGIRFISNLGYFDPRTEIGELLWKNRWGPEEVEVEKAKGELRYVGLFQQRPSLYNGNVFKREWFEPRVLNIDVKKRFISVDTASSIKPEADYTSICVSEITSELKLFIREIIRVKAPFPQLVEIIQKLVKKYGYGLEHIFVEAKANGISLIQSLESVLEPEIAELIYAYTPKGDKLQRAFESSVFTQAGSVLLPPHTKEFEWLLDFEDEFFQFPGNVRHDDQVDSVTMTITLLSNLLSQGISERQGVN